MPYIDKPEDLLAIAHAVSAAETAKMAIVRPTNHFAVMTADNPDMVRTLALQEEFVSSKLLELRFELSSQALAQQRQKWVQVFQSHLAEQAKREQKKLIDYLKGQGVVSFELVEDKGVLETSKFDYYTDQVFATDTGQYFDDRGTLVFIPAYFKNPQRKDEERLAIAQARNLNAEIRPLTSEHGKRILFEGGDIRQMIGKKLFFIGQGYRSAPCTGRAIAQISDYYVVPIQLLQEQFYHLDCCFLPLPNDAAVLYEGDYIQDDVGEVLLDEKGWPKIRPGTETMTSESRQRIRTLYGTDKLILIDKQEALAFATNAAVLQAQDGRFKMFVNGDDTSPVTDENEALKVHQISFRAQSFEAIKRVTKGDMDIIEVPYCTMHGSGGSIRCSIQEVACTREALMPHSDKSGYFTEKAEVLEQTTLKSRLGFFSCGNKEFEEPEGSTPMRSYSI